MVGEKVKGTMLGLMVALGAGNSAITVNRVEMIPVRKDSSVDYRGDWQSPHRNLFERLNICGFHCIWLEARVSRVVC